MSEVSKQKEKPDGYEKLVNEGSAARTRPTSVEEIMQRRKRKESLANVKEGTVGAAQLLGNDLVEKASEYQEFGKGNDRPSKVNPEERVMKSSKEEEGGTSSSREERLDKPMKEDPVGASQVLSEKGYDGSEKLRRERVKNSFRKREDAISSSREERQDPTGAAQLLGSDLVEKVSDYPAFEKDHERSKKVSREERGKDSSRKKEDATSSYREERLHKPVKEDPVRAAQLLGNNLVEKVSHCHAAEKEHERSKKVTYEERVKESSRKKENATSNSRDDRLDKLTKEMHVNDRNDLVEKVSDYHASDKEHDRAKNVRSEERVKDSSRKKKDAISSSRKEKLMKKDSAGAAQLQGNDLVEKDSDYRKSKKDHEISNKVSREERVKDSSRKKEAFSSSSSSKKEEHVGNRKRKAGVGSTAETTSVEGHSKDRRRKKEESNSSGREERLDEKMKNEDFAANRNARVKGEATIMKEKRERPAAKTSIKHVRPQETGSVHARSARESLSGSKKRLRSLVVADIPRHECSMEPDSGNQRKNYNGDHMKNREKNVLRMHDSHSVEISERWEKRERPKSVDVSERWEKREHPKPDQRDMGEKRRRSRSRDHGQDRQKRSSPLPRAETDTSRHKRDHEERSENTVKDRSGKRHYDNENKVASTVNNKSRRYTASKSELGGYSPRKRREETSARAASPPNLSSEKKDAKWDLPPTVTAGMFSGSVFSGLQAATQTAYPTMSEASLTLLKPLMEASFKTPPARQTTAADPVQLTESTRRMRRLYAENVPDSASEKSLIECFNGYMLSSGSNHIKGSEPCISCIINKEKGQALVEFLTPQDASAALSLDGYSFAGSNLKIRRPKDYVEITSGELEKKEPATNALGDYVEDSSNKIFIGGFSKAISSEMLLEIVSVFGPLKAYRFITTNDLNQRCAFLEYTDGSVTLKACAGLNGMKLGGSVITAVCAFPDASSVTVNDNPPFYGIPEHAKPLLGKPKHILKLKNVFDPKDLPSLSEAEVKEILEDVRLECARFGVIKSINIVEHESKDISGCKTDAPLNTDSKEMNMSVIQETDEGSKKADDVSDNVDPGEVNRTDSLTGEDKLCEPCSVATVETMTQGNGDHDSTEQDNCGKIVEEGAQDTAEMPQAEVESACAQDRAKIPQEEVGSACTQEEAENPQEVGLAARAVKTRWDSCDKTEQEQDPGEVFEPGCILIEYRRPEAASDAAHSLHGRLYENRIVKVEYVSKELYQIRFPSG